MSDTLAVVTNLGQMKLYRREVDPLERVSYQELESFENPEAIRSNQERLSDKSGSFQGVGGSGSSGEVEKINLETEKRAIAHWANQIKQSLHEHGCKRWHLAAPANINKRLLEQLDAKLQESLGKNLASDLVSTAPSELPKHFQ